MNTHDKTVHSLHGNEYRIIATKRHMGIWFYLCANLANKNDVGYIAQNIDGITSPFCTSVHDAHKCIERMELRAMFADFMGKKDKNTKEKLQWQK